MTLIVKASGRCWSLSLWEWVVTWEHWDFGLDSSELAVLKVALEWSQEPLVRQQGRIWCLSSSCVRVNWGQVGTGHCRDRTYKVIVGTGTPVLGQERWQHARQGCSDWICSDWNWDMGRITGMGWSLHSLGSDMFIFNQHTSVKNPPCARHCALCPGFLLAISSTLCALLSFKSHFGLLVNSILSTSQRSRVT